MYVPVHESYVPYDLYSISFFILFHYNLLPIKIVSLEFWNEILSFNLQQEEIS